ncbi:MAG: SRPBCC domain-containing protein [Candidatus Levyibacteriota bacterium]
MIKQSVHLNATPEDVYEALMDEKKHAEFTGASAQIENRVGGKFSVWDGYATGETTELIPGKKIVQSWRASDWPEDADSTVTFELKPDGDGTTLIFTHSHVPPEFKKEVSDGWKDFYWEPLKKYLAKNQ